MHGCSPVLSQGFLFCGDHQLNVDSIYVLVIKNVKIEFSFMVPWL